MKSESASVRTPTPSTAGFGECSRGSPTLYSATECGVGSFSLMNESTEEKYRRLQREIQGAILRNYPNPKRQGCPGDATVRTLAEKPDSIKAEDEADEQGAWYHITHCSPCYTSFLELRNAGRAGRHHPAPDTPHGGRGDIPQRRGWRRLLDWFSMKRQDSVQRSGF